MEGPTPVPDGMRALLQADLDDLTERLEGARRRYRRHLLWLLLGASPGALLPMLFVVSEVGGGALVVVILGVLMVEGWRALRAKRLIRRLETQFMEVRDRWDATIEAGANPTASPHTGSRT